jgi:hypothetical protein
LFTNELILERNLTSVIFVASIFPTQGLFPSTGEFTYNGDSCYIHFDVMITSELTASLSHAGKVRILLSVHHENTWGMEVVLYIFLSVALDGD